MKAKNKKKEPTLAERLTAIETDHEISGNELARILGLSSSDYHNKYKTSHKTPTLWQRTALDYIEKYGIALLQKADR